VVAVDYNFAEAHFLGHYHDLGYCTQLNHLEENPSDQDLWDKVAVAGNFLHFVSCWVLLHLKMWEDFQVFVLEKFDLLLVLPGHSLDHLVVVVVIVVVVAAVAVVVVVDS